MHHTAIRISLCAIRMYFSMYQVLDFLWHHLDFFGFVVDLPDNRVIQAGALVRTVLTAAAQVGSQPAAQVVAVNQSLFSAWLWRPVGPVWSSLLV